MIIADSISYISYIYMIYIYINIIYIYMYISYIDYSAPKIRRKSKLQSRSA